MDIRHALPEHPTPEEVRKGAGRPELRVDGLVQLQRWLRPADLGGLPRVAIRAPFECEEGWRVPDLGWRGVRLLDVLQLARPKPEARWVRVSSGPYAVSVGLAEAESTLLAEELDGQPLTLAHGGPWRLVVPERECFASVKWVDSLTLTDEAGEQSGEAIARRRLTSG